MIFKASSKDFQDIYEIINDGATAYKGVIPADSWHEPYMPEAELKKQIKEGVEFWCYQEDGKIIGVMGTQDKGDVVLIRHAYVRTEHRNKGIGSKLLRYLLAMPTKPVLIGAWAAADWAIEFYRKHGFRLLEKDEARKLHHRYWSIPEEQIETSVVLADANWIAT